MLPKRNNKDPDAIAERRRLLQSAVDAYEECGSLRKAASMLKIPYSTLDSWVELGRQENIVPTQLRGIMGFPKGIKNDYDVLDITRERVMLVISDVHVPYHDERALELALDYGIERGMDTLFINGDFMDLPAVSDHGKSMLERSGLAEDFNVGKAVLREFRDRLPDAEIYYNEGNHETRMTRYITKHAAELEGLDGIAVPYQLKLSMYGVKWIDESCDIRLGDLNLFHGHEYRGGGMMVARSKFLQAMDNILISNFHRTQQFTKPNIRGKVKGSWVTGCLCDLHPAYLLKNDWNLGFALVHSRDDGHFVIENKQIIDDKIY